MIYTSEDTTGALLREVATGRLDLAIVFCPPDQVPDGVVLLELPAQPAVLHVREDHPLAGRASVQLGDLAQDTILVAGGRDSGGFTDRVVRAFAAAGVEQPRTRPDPYPDLGLQAVREGLGVVVYARSAFPPDLAGSAFVPIDPPVTLPFALAYRPEASSAALASVLAVAADL